MKILSTVVCFFAINCARKLQTDDDFFLEKDDWPPVRTDYTYQDFLKLINENIKGNLRGLRPR